MSDLRSCREAVDHFQLIIDATNTDSRYNEGFVDGLEFCISHLSTMPSVQPEIIRCRDCRWRKDQSGSVAWLPCRAIVTPSDFYCGRAERRTDD